MGILSLVSHTRDVKILFSLANTLIPTKDQNSCPLLYLGHTYTIANEEYICVREADDLNLAKSVLTAKREF